MKNIKKILILIILICIIMIIINITTNRTLEKCKNNKIIYKYVPASFKTEQEHPEYISKLFNKLFTESSIIN